MKAMVDGQLHSTQNASLEPADATGVFETLLLRSGAALFFEEHFQRYSAGCRHFALTGAPDRAVLLDAADTLIRANGITEGVLRWSAWQSTTSGAHWTMRVEHPRSHTLKPIWSAMFAPTRLPPPDSGAAFKHLSRRIWRDALLQSRGQGFDEVLLQDINGQVVEGAVSNVFFVTQGILRTPALASGPLPGITRAKVIGLAGELGLSLDEGVVSPADLRSSQEIFLTNSLAGIRPISTLESTILPAPGPVTLRLQTAWRARYG